MNLSTEKVDRVMLINVIGVPAHKKRTPFRTKGVRFSVLKSG